MADHCCYGRRDAGWNYVNQRWPLQIFNETFVCDAGLTAVQAYLSSGGSDPALVGVDSDISSLSARRDNTFPCHEFHYLDVEANTRTRETFSCVMSNMNLVNFADAISTTTAWASGSCENGCRYEYLQCNVHYNGGFCDVMAETTTKTDGTFRAFEDSNATRTAARSTHTPLSAVPQPATDAHGRSGTRPCAPAPPRPRAAPPLCAQFQRAWTDQTQAPC